MCVCVFVCMLMCGEYALICANVNACMCTIYSYMYVECRTDTIFVSETNMPIGYYMLHVFCNRIR